MKSFLRFVFKRNMTSLLSLHQHLRSTHVIRTAEITCCTAGDRDACKECCARLHDFSLYVATNATRHRERAERFLTAKTLISRSPVDAIVTRQVFLRVREIIRPTVSRAPSPILELHTNFKGLVAFLPGYARSSALPPVERRVANRRVMGPVEVVLRAWRWVSLICKRQDPSVIARNPDRKQAPIGHGYLGAQMFDTVGTRVCRSNGF